MRQSLLLLGVVLVVAAFVGMMRIKTDVQTLDTQREKLVLERAKLRETKRVLEAEWALLASPERLRKMASGLGYVPGSALDVVPLVPPVAAVAVSAVVPTVSITWQTAASVTTVTEETDATSDAAPDEEANTTTVSPTAPEDPAPTEE
jgi:hypothetical protein